MKNGMEKMAAAFLFGESMQGNPLFLMLGIACLAGGVWYMIKDRKKSKEQREDERKQVSKRFMDNINRHEAMLMDKDEPDRRFEREAENPEKQPEKNSKKKQG